MAAGRFELAVSVATLALPDIPDLPPPRDPVPIRTVLKKWGPPPPPPYACMNTGWPIPLHLKFFQRSPLLHSGPQSIMVPPAGIGIRSTRTCALERQRFCFQ